MTRENYFKIAESQGLTTMREDMDSIMSTTKNQFMIGAGVTNRSNFNVSKA